MLKYHLVKGIPRFTSQKIIYLNILPIASRKKKVSVWYVMKMKMVALLAITHSKFAPIIQMALLSVFQGGVIY